MLYALENSEKWENPRKITLTNGYIEVQKVLLTRMQTRKEKKNFFLRDAKYGGNKFFFPENAKTKSH